jgi:hypothetical protein
MNVIIYMHLRHLQSELFIIETTCDDIEDLLMDDQFLVVRSSDGIQYTVPLELISYIEQDVSEYVDELQENMLENM